MGRSHALLVLHLQVGTLIDEEFDHLKSVSLDRIVDWPLILSVCDIQRRAQVEQMLHDPDMTLSYSVVDGGLPVLILSIERIWAAL